MKPKTKIQKQIVAYSDSLTAISPKVISKLQKQAFKPEGYLCSGTCTCTECGCSFTNSVSPLSSILEKQTERCPQCLTKLRIIATRKRKDKDTRYLCTSTYVGNFQVLRFIESIRNVTKGKAAGYNTCETVRVFIDVNQPLTKHVVALRPMQNWHNIGFVWGSEMEYRDPRPDYNGYDKYNINPYASIIEKAHPILKRKGFKSSFHDINPEGLIRKVSLWSKHETLLKAKQYKLLRRYINFPQELEQWWHATKICMRNRYIVKDASMWIDLLRALQDLGKDTHNAYYVCPKNLKKAHDYWLSKTNHIKRGTAIDVLKKKASDLETRLKPYIGLAVAKSGLEISLLHTVEQYYTEGEKLKHCVKTYVDKKDSLIFSCKKDNDHYATLEYSLISNKVTQCRGINNKQVDEHDTLIRLVNKLSIEIKARYETAQAPTVEAKHLRNRRNQAAVRSNMQAIRL